jgi:hypothetical protein
MTDPSHDTLRQGTGGLHGDKYAQELNAVPSTPGGHGNGVRQHCGCPQAQGVPRPPRPARLEPRGISRGPRPGALYGTGRPGSPSPPARGAGRPAPGLHTGVAGARPEAGQAKPGSRPPPRPARPPQASYLQRRRGGRGTGEGRARRERGDLGSSGGRGGLEGRGLRASAGRRRRAPGRPGPAVRAAATKPRAACRSLGAAEGRERGPAQYPPPPAAAAGSAPALCRHHWADPAPFAHLGGGAPGGARPTVCHRHAHQQKNAFFTRDVAGTGTS